MLTLAFESSAKSASVALCDGDVLLAQYFQNCGLTHSRTLLPMAEDLLKNTERKISDIDVFAVSNGPGSFTGLRIGIAAVKGLCFGTDRPAVPVSSLLAAAWNGISAPAGSVICAVMDARRNQVYNALFRCDGEKPLRLCPDRALSLSELLKDVSASGDRLFLVGDGAPLAYDFFRRAGLSVVLPRNLIQQCAWGVAMAASEQSPVPAAELVPFYLRLSQAERERQEKTEGGSARPDFEIN